MTSSSSTDGKRGGAVLCAHCGKHLRVFTGTHPWRHVETGNPACAPTTKAEPVTLRAEDAPEYLQDMIRGAQHHLDAAHALLTEAEKIMAKMAAGERYNL